MRTPSPLALLVLALVASFAPAQVAGAPARGEEVRLPEAPAPERRLRLGTWNLLNLFDNADEPGKPDEGTDPKSSFELELMARAIDDMDADVLGVQEVENRAVLEALNARLQRPYLFVELIEGNDFRGIDCGILSRFPIVAATSHRLRDLGDDLRFARDFPLFRIAYAEGRAMEVGVVHLKSKRGDSGDSDAWRRAEAAGIRAILDRRRALDPETPLVVMGDFNDRRDAKTLEPVFGLLRDPSATLLPEAERWTFDHRGTREQIDFILTTPDLDVRRVHVLHREDSPSDHAPLLLDLDAGVTLSRPTVPAGLAPKPSPRPELAAKDLKALEAHLLQEVRVTGQVAHVHRPRSGGAVLNFLKDYKKAVTVFVPEDALPRFGKLDELIGKTVSVAGPVCRYRDVLQIRLTRPEQLR